VWPGFGRWRDRLAALRPAVLRLLITWHRVQPQPTAPPNWDIPDPGCVRDKRPCGPWAGVRDQLRAIAALQRRQGGGPEVEVSFLYPPAWAAEPPGGCEPPGLLPVNRGPSAAALPAYAALVRGLLDVAAQERARITWWSPWNEPNYAPFLAPQRARCDPAAPSLAVARYAALARTMKAQLDAAPGDQRLVLGDLAQVPEGDRVHTGPVEFIRGLPPDVACAGDVWAQHVYVDVPPPGRPAPPAGAPALLAAITRALDAQGCPARKRIWITETGAGGPVPGRARDPSPAALRRACRRMDEALARWRDDPRVDVALQYTAREDDRFPVGLVDTALTRAYPALDLWAAWGGLRAPGDPAPPLPPSCR
jgi:hypothetical protein